MAPDHASLSGLEGLVRRAGGRWPVVAVGGITPATAATVRATGADGLAVSSAMSGAPDVAAAARSLRSA